jgi:octaprenyl-diphosphate synthase
LGIAFQLVDDALDYSFGHDATGKPLGGDLREGKLTLPLILFLQKQDKATQQELLSKIKERQLTEKEHQWIVNQVKNNEIVHSTRQVAQVYLDKAMQALEQFPGSSERDLLESVLSYIQTREN